MAAEIIGLGCALQIGDGGGSEVFTTIAGVTNVSWSGISQEIVDVTDLADTWREFLGGIKDGGEISFGLNFRPTEVTQGSASGGVIDDLETGTVRNFKLVFSDTGATEWDFSALVSDFEMDAPLEDKITGSVSLKVSGAPTLASS